MQARKLSLASIMDQWDGEDLMLQVQGNRVTAVGSKRSKIKRSEPGLGLFSRMAQGNRYKENREGPGEGQFVIKAKQKNRTYRVSLADLGEAYNTSRVNLNVRKQRRISQNLEPKQNTKTKPSFTNQIHQQNMNKVDNYSKYQTQNPDRKQRRTISEFNTINHNYNNFDHQYTHQQSKSTRNKSNSKVPLPERIQNQQNKLEQIRQSIQSIRLPHNSNQCPEYNSANQRFQNMKRQILEKIIESGEIHEVSDIIKEIRQAADQIIARHYPAQPTLKKPGNGGIFSFQVKEAPSVQPTINTNFTLNKISEYHPDDKIQGINLPQFKDDAGSISSILSLNGNQIKKDDSSSHNEDFCKIDNVFIRDGFEGNNHREDESVSSIKPIILNEEKNQNDFGEIFKQAKEEQKLHETIREAAQTVFQSQANNHVLASVRKPEEKSIVRESQALPQIQSFAQAKAILPQVSIQQQIQSQPQIKSEQKVQAYENIFKKKEEPDQGPPIQYQAYDLEKLTSKPVKIIQNLQQAKKFDPEITKFTQLKAQYLQTRTHNPQIITIPSPLRFRRKQQVVKHLVATQLVDKESKSIEY